MTPAIVGLTFELAVAALEHVNSPFIPFYSLFIVIWGVCMLEFWKRSQAFIAMEAGMLDFEASETVRAEFEYEEKLNLAGKELLYFPDMKRNVLVTESYLVIMLLCFLVIGTTACIYVIKYHIATSSEEGYQYASYIASILSAIQVQAYGLIYGSLSKFLTDRENHM